MSDVKLKAAVCGVSGRLGRTIAHQLISRSDTQITGGMVSTSSVHLGADLGEIADTGYLGVEAVVSLEEAAAALDLREMAAVGTPIPMQMYSPRGLRGRRARLG